MILKEFMDKYIHKIDEININFIKSFKIAEKLKEAMLYSYTAGGKIKAFIIFSNFICLRN